MMRKETKNLPGFMPMNTAPTVHRAPSTRPSTMRVGMRLKGLARPEAALEAFFSALCQESMAALAASFRPAS